MPLTILDLAVLGVVLISALLAMANGLALEMFQDPISDHDACVAADVDAALYMLGAERS